MQQAVGVALSACKLEWCGPRPTNAAQLKVSDGDGALGGAPASRERVGACCIVNVGKYGVLSTSASCAAARHASSAHLTEAAHPGRPAGSPRYAHLPDVERRSKPAGPTSAKNQPSTYERTATSCVRS